MSVCLLNKGEKIISDALAKETEASLMSLKMESKNLLMKVHEKMDEATKMPEKTRPHITDLPSIDKTKALASPGVMDVPNGKTISRKEEELLNCNIINTARRHGLSEAALFVYDTIKSPPTVSFNLCLIKSFQYLDYFHFDTFQYGLKELELMGFIFSYKEDRGSYRLYFTPKGIDAFSNRSLLDTRDYTLPAIAETKDVYDKTKLNSAVLYLMRECSGLEANLPSLIKVGYVEIKDNFLCWKKSKQSLAQFFGDVLCYTMWSDIEKAFRTNRLNGSYHHATANSREIIELKEMCRIE